MRNRPVQQHRPVFSRDKNGRNRRGSVHWEYYADSSNSKSTHSWSMITSKPSIVLAYGSPICPKFASPFLAGSCVAGTTELIFPTIADSSTSAGINFPVVLYRSPWYTIDGTIVLGASGTACFFIPHPANARTQTSADSNVINFFIQSQPYVNLEFLILAHVPRVLSSIMIFLQPSQRYAVTCPP